jgi:hypothetical protein
MIDRSACSVRPAFAALNAPSRVADYEGAIFSWFQPIVNLFLPVRTTRALTVPKKVLLARNLSATMRNT